MQWQPTKTRPHQAPAPAVTTAIDPTAKPAKKKLDKATPDRR